MERTISEEEAANVGDDTEKDGIHAALGPIDRDCSASLVSIALQMR